MLHLNIKNRYSGAQNFEKFDSRAFQSGYIVHFLRRAYRKVDPCNGILAYHGKGAWNRIWQKNSGLVIEMTRLDLHQLDSTKDS